MHLLHGACKIVAKGVGLNRWALDGIELYVDLD